MSGAVAQFQEAGTINPYLWATFGTIPASVVKAGQDLRGRAAVPAGVGTESFLGQGPERPRGGPGQPGKVAEAEQAFQRALEADSTLLSARGNLAALLEKEGKFSEALKDYQQALDTDPADLKTYDHMVRVLGK